jgi:hypothetical protein
MVFVATTELVSTTVGVVLVPDHVGFGDHRDLPLVAPGLPPQAELASDVLTGDNSALVQDWYIRRVAVEVEVFVVGGDNPGRAEERDIRHRRQGERPPSRRQQTIILSHDPSPWIDKKIPFRSFPTIKMTSPSNASSHHLLVDVSPKNPCGQNFPAEETRFVV